MARYGALTALQAALLGISGGAQGLVQAREREQKEGERRKQFEREELRDQREIARDKAEADYRAAQLRQQAEETTQRGILTREEIASREKVAGIQAGTSAAERAEKRRSALNEASAWWAQNYVGPGAANLPGNVTPEQREYSNRIARTYSTLRADANKRGQKPTAQELMAAVYAVEQAREFAESRSRAGSKGDEVKRPSLDDRIKALVALDYSDSQIRETLVSEGYDLTNMR